MIKFKLFILGSFKELKDKVSWPSYSSVQGSTVLVIFSSIIFAILIGLLDVSFKKLLSIVYGT